MDVAELRPRPTNKCHLAAVRFHIIFKLFLKHIGCHVVAMMSDGNLYTGIVSKLRNRRNVAIVLHDFKLCLCHVASKYR